MKNKSNVSADVDYQLKPTTHHVVVRQVDWVPPAPAGKIQIVSPAVDAQKLTDRQRTFYGEVLAVAQGRKDQHGNRADAPCAVGDMVAFSCVIGCRAVIGSSSRVILNFDEVLAVVDPRP